MIFLHHSTAEKNECFLFGVKVLVGFVILQIVLGLLADQANRIVVGLNVVLEIRLGLGCALTLGSVTFVKFSRCFLETLNP